MSEGREVKFIEKIIENKEDSHVIIRISTKSKQDFKKWFAGYQAKNRLTFRVRNTRPCTGQKVVYKARYRCHHNTYPNSHKVKTPSAKHTGCPAVAIVTIDAVDDSKLKVKSVKLPTTIRISHNHNHGVNTIETLKHRDPSLEIRHKFLNLFKSHYPPSRALELHRLDLMAANEDDYLSKSVDRSICPDLRWVNNFYRSGYLKDSNKKDSLKDFLKTSVKETVKNISEAINSEINFKISFNDDHFVFALCTPLMERSHTLQQAGQIVYIDTSRYIDRFNCRVLVLMTDSSVGGLPLGLIATSIEKEALLIEGFELLKTILPPNRFYSRKSPCVLMTDDSVAQRNAIKHCFPESKIQICPFFILQSIWRWLADPKQGICRDHRKILYYCVKQIFRCQCEEDITRFKLQFFSNEIVDCYENFKKLIDEKYLKRKELWLDSFKFFNDIFNTNLNIFFDTILRVFKDKIFYRTKSSNLFQLFNFLVYDLPTYFHRKIIDNLSGKLVSYSYLKYVPRGNVLKYLIMIHSGEDVCVLGDSGTNTWFEVNSGLGVCSCPLGSKGFACKHQYFVASTLNSPNILTFAPQEAEYYCWVASGSVNLPAEDAEDLQMAEDTLADDLESPEHDDVSDTCFSYEDCRKKLNDFTELILKDFDENPEDVTSTVAQFCEKMINFNNSSDRLQALRMIDQSASTKLKIDDFLLNKMGTRSVDSLG